MLMRQSESCLLIVDLQEKLLPVIDRGSEVLAHACWLVDVARELGVPVIASEQYPRGIGHTVPEMARRLRPEEIAEKIHFSCLGDNCLEKLPGFERAQIVVAGTESHVCVLQTVLDLQAAGKQVFVVEEAVGSRRGSDKALALERMCQAGATIVSREMVAFEWLGAAGTDVFRRVSKNFIV